MKNRKTNNGDTVQPRHERLSESEHNQNPPSVWRLRRRAATQAGHEYKMEHKTKYALNPWSYEIQNCQTRCLEFRTAIDQTMNIIRCYQSVTFKRYGSPLPLSMISFKSARNVYTSEFIILTKRAQTFKKKIVFKLSDKMGGGSEGWCVGDGMRNWTEAQLSRAYGSSQSCRGILSIRSASLFKSCVARSSSLFNFVARSSSLFKSFVTRSSRCSVSHAGASTYKRSLLRYSHFAKSTCFSEYLFGILPPKTCIFNYQMRVWREWVGHKCTPLRKSCSIELVNLCMCFLIS